MVLIKFVLRLATLAFLLLDASLLLVLAAPGAAGPVFRVATLWSTRYEGCNLADVVRSEREGLNPIPTGLETAIHVVGHDGDLDLLATPLGDFWTRRKEARTLYSMIAGQIEGAYEVGGRGVHSGDIVLDCGANIGVYTRHALSVGARQVIATEPSPELLPLLRRNLAPEIDSGKVILAEKDIAAPLTTIDLLVRDAKLDRVDFIKIDVGGAERQALRGALDTVKRFHPRLAVALDHLERGPEEIPPYILSLWPQLHTICGPCTMQTPGPRFRVQPQVVAAY